LGNLNSRVLANDALEWRDERQGPQQNEKSNEILHGGLHSWRVLADPQEFTLLALRGIATASVSVISR
jgi:hypothetical protein